MCIMGADHQLCTKTLVHMSKNLNREGVVKKEDHDSKSSQKRQSQLSNSDTWFANRACE